VPRRSLTAASVERIKPPAKGQVDHFDRGFPGLALRVSYAGGKSFVFFYRIAGRLRRMTLGTYPALSLADAREEWRKARQEAQRGRDPALERKRVKSATDFEGVCREWLKRDQARNRTYRQIERIAEGELIPAWGSRPIEDIGRRDILDLVDGIVDRGSVTMARRVQMYVHRLFKWAAGRGIVETNPAANVPLPGSETSRDRVLTDGELAATWQSLNHIEWPHKPIFQLLILTGARRGEIGELRWAEVGDEEIKLEGVRTKNGKPHLIPLSSAARRIIETLPRIAGMDFVFGTGGRTPGGYDRAKAKLDSQIAELNGKPLAPWRIHDWRRSVATGLQKLGVTLQVIESVLGHTGGSRSGIVGVYQRHSFDAEKRAALEAWGAHVMALVDGKASGKVLPMRGKR
jgi:integrase